MSSRLVLTCPAIDATEHTAIMMPVVSGASLAFVQRPEVVSIRGVFEVHVQLFVDGSLSRVCE
eukprot:11816145-Alexandrium_andersonii.AAC.1